MQKFLSKTMDAVVLIRQRMQDRRVCIRQRMQESLYNRKRMQESLYQTLVQGSLHTADEGVSI